MIRVLQSSCNITDFLPQMATSCILLASVLRHTEDRVPFIPGTLTDNVQNADLYSSLSGKIYLSWVPLH